MNKLKGNNSIIKKKESKTLLSSVSIYEGRTHRPYCLDCGTPFSPDNFTIKDGKRYENYCKTCYNKRKNAYRKKIKKKKATQKKSLQSRANNKVIDLDDFTSEIVSIETNQFNAVTKSLLMNLVEDIFEK